MISKTQVWHKIHVRVDWWTFFFHPRPPWRRNGGSKICLECKITRFFPKSDGLDWGDRGHLVASTSILGYRIHVGVDWWTQNFYPRPPSAPKVDQKICSKFRFWPALAFDHFKKQGGGQKRRSPLIRDNFFDPLLELNEVPYRKQKFTNRLICIFCTKWGVGNNNRVSLAQNHTCRNPSENLIFSYSKEIFDPPFRGQGSLG